MSDSPFSSLPGTCDRNSTDTVKKLGVRCSATRSRVSIRRSTYVDQAGQNRVSRSAFCANESVNLTSRFATPSRASSRARVASATMVLWRSSFSALAAICALTRRADAK